MNPSLFYIEPGLYSGNHKLVSDSLNLCSGIVGLLPEDNGNSDMNIMTQQIQLWIWIKYYDSQQNYL